jgi:hypothetical protein
VFCCKEGPKPGCLDGKTGFSLGCAKLPASNNDFAVYTCSFIASHMFSGRDITLSIIISDRSDQNQATNITLVLASFCHITYRSERCSTPTEAVHISETSVYFNETTRRCIPEDMSSSFSPP